MKKYKINENYFENIDSHQKAYFYGLLWADGSISNQYILSLQLTSPDEHIIHSLNDEMNSNHNVYYYEKTNSYRLSVYSKTLWQTLNNLNIVVNKTYKNLSPLIPDQYFWSFLLGLFDGDGSISGKTFCICNNVATVNLIQQKFNQFNITSNISDTKGVAKCIRVCRAQDIHFIYEKFYENVKHFLIRKKKKFDELGFGKNFKPQTSKYKGVCFNKIRNRWEAILSKDNKRIFHKDYKTELEAVLARNEIVRQTFKTDQKEINKRLNYL